MKQKLLILLAALLATVNAYAYDFEYTYQGQTLKYDILSETTCGVSQGNSISGDVTIPETVNYNGQNYDVVKIGSRAFSGSRIASVTIPNSITSIGDYAFSSSTLTSLTIPESVTSIGNGAFSGCRLTSVTYPGWATSIGNDIFSSCRNLTSITFPEGTLAIADGAFASCISLEMFSLPNSLLSIGNSAFAGCTSLESVLIPNSVTSIGDQAFEGCLNISSFYGKYSYDNNRLLIIDERLVALAPKGLTSCNIPNTVKVIGAGAFYGCTELISINIPYGVTTIGGRAFGSCENLTSVTLPESISTIDNYAFSCCFKLVTLTLPESITVIGERAFSQCWALKSVRYPGQAASIGDDIFYECKNLTSVIFPDETTAISKGAFYNCTSIESISLPSSLTLIGNSAFSGCTNLKSVTIPENVSSIGASAFSRCSNITSVIFPETITSLGDGAFSGCSNLGLIQIPKSIKAIGSGVFLECTALTSLILPESIESIGEAAFLRCTGLTSLIFPKSLTTIGPAAFMGCTNITSIKLKSSNPGDISIQPISLNGVNYATCILLVPNGSKALYGASSPWNSFANIEEYIDRFDLVDNQPYVVTEDYSDIDVTYTRTFIPDIWQPLYVPFNMSYDEWKDYGQVAELSCVHAYEDGRTTIEFVTVNSGELLPNVPYVFLPNTGDEITFNCANKTLKAAPAENTKYIMCSSPRYTFKIYGNYQSVSGSTLSSYGDSQFNGAYVMTTDNKFQHCSPSATLKPYRFYITREKSANGYWGAPARQNALAADNDDDDVIYFMVDGVICGIADIVNDIDGNEAIYDLMGREVKNPSNGIYIQNGKKIRIY